MQPTKTTIILYSETEVKLFNRARRGGAELLPFTLETAESFNCFEDAPSPTRAETVVRAALDGFRPYRSRKNRKAGKGGTRTSGTRHAPQAA